MIVFLRVGWVLLVLGSFAAMLGYAWANNGWSCAAMGAVFLLLLALRSELTELGS